MKYLVINSDGVIENIIVADAGFAESIGAVPAYEGAKIGAAYEPPEPETETEPAGPETSAGLEQLRADVDYLLMMTEG